MNPIIIELLKNDIPVSLQYNKHDDRVEYIVSGFYKSDVVTMAENEGVLKYVTRYGITGEADDLSTLVRLNHEWWMSSRDRYEGWAQPDPKWLPLLIKAGLVEQVTKTYYK